MSWITSPRTLAEEIGTLAENNSSTTQAERIQVRKLRRNAFPDSGLV